MKYVDNSTNNDRITNNNESSYWKELNSHAEWSAENELLLNMSKVKELIVGFMKKEAKIQYVSKYVCNYLLCTTRLQTSFFLQAVRILTSSRFNEP